MSEVVPPSKACDFVMSVLLLFLSTLQADPYYLSARSVSFGCKEVLLGGLLVEVCLLSTLVCAPCFGTLGILHFRSLVENMVSVLYKSRTVGILGRNDDFLKPRKYQP
jgi:hypothetical protein